MAKIQNKKSGTNTFTLPKEYVKAALTASYYGFNHISDISVEREDLQKAKSYRESSFKEVKPFADSQHTFSGYFEEKIAVMRNYLDKKMSHLPQPIMIFYEGPLKGNPHIKKVFKERTFNLEIIGNPKSSAEAMIIETAFLIAKDHYPKANLSVELNSIGDKESLGRFLKEVGKYYKKHMTNLPGQCRHIAREDIFEALNCGDTACRELAEGAPKSMSYLTEPRTNVLQVGYKNCLTIAMSLYAAGTLLLVPGLRAGRYSVVLLAFLIIGSGFTVQMVAGSPLISALGKRDGSSSSLNFGNALGAIAQIIAPATLTIISPPPLSRCRANCRTWKAFLLPSGWVWLF